MFALIKQATKFILLGELKRMIKKLENNSGGMHE